MRVDSSVEAQRNTTRAWNSIVSIVCASITRTPVARPCFAVVHDAVHHAVRPEREPARGARAAGSVDVDAVEVGVGDAAPLAGPQ